MNSLDKHFVEKVENPDFDFTGWRVCGKLDNPFAAETVYRTKSEYWLSEFMIAITGGLILVDPDCPEVYLVDTDKTLINMMRDIAKDDNFEIFKRSLVWDPVLEGDLTVKDPSQAITWMYSPTTNTITTANYGYVTTSLSTTSLLGSTGPI